MNNEGIEEALVYVGGNVPGEQGLEAMDLGMEGGVMRVIWMYDQGCLLPGSGQGPR